MAETEKKIVVKRVWDKDGYWMEQAHLEGFENEPRRGHSPADAIGHLVYDFTIFYPERFGITIVGE